MESPFTSARKAAGAERAWTMRHYRDNSARVTQVTQDWATARTAEVIERNLAKAPPLRPEQIAELHAVIDSIATVDGAA